MGEAPLGPQTPPCRTCGAALREENGNDPTAVQVLLVCPYCGSRDELPREAAARAIAIRTLNAQRRWAEDGVKGRAVGLLRGLDAIAPTVVGYGLLACTVAGSVAAQWGSLRGVLGASRASGIAGSVGATLAISTFAPIGALVAITVFVGLGVPRVRRRALRELPRFLRARPPVRGRGRATCRRCGAELLFGTDAVTPCSYCGAQNFVGAQMAVDVSQLGSATLDDARAMEERARQTTEALNKALWWATAGAFFVAGPIGAVLGGAAGYALCVY